jgi:copper(I)-binding protein
MSMLALGVVFLTGGVSGVFSQTPPAIEIGHPWSRVTGGVASGVVYMSVVNHGTVDDTLTHAQTPVAKSAELHISSEQNGVMTMRPAGSVPVKAGSTVDFKPEGLHVMLMGLTHPLAAGDSFPITLTFEKAGAVQATVTVEKEGEMMEHHHHGMPGMN